MSGNAGLEARGGPVYSVNPTNRKRNSTPTSILRSEEIMPIDQRFDSGKQGGSAASDTGGSLNSISSSEGSS